MDVWDMMTEEMSRKWHNEKDGKSMAKRIDMNRSKFLVILRGNYRVLACEPDGVVWVCRKRFNTRNDAYDALFKRIVNPEGWDSLGPFRYKP